MARRAACRLHWPPARRASSKRSPGSSSCIATRGFVSAQGVSSARHAQATTKEFTSNIGLSRAPRGSTARRPEQLEGGGRDRACMVAYGPATTAPSYRGRQDDRATGARIVAQSGLARKMRWTRPPHTLPAARPPGPMPYYRILPTTTHTTTAPALTLAHSMRALCWRPLPHDAVQEALAAVAVR